MITRAVHAWSLHRTLGRFVADHANPPGGSQHVRSGPVDGVTVLELPSLLAEHGFDTVQLCHFHLGSRDPGYLRDVRGALAAAGVTLGALLVDAGDLVHPTDADAHEAWIAGWFADAEILGARRIRVIAGQQPPTPERLADSGRRLRRLAAAAPVRLVTENWLALLPTAADVRAVLDAAAGDVGLLVDLGNWKGSGKYDELAAIGGLAETSHAKCGTLDDGTLDEVDYRRSLRAVLDAGFTGPLCCVYEGPDEWAALAAIQDVIDDEIA